MTKADRDLFVYGLGMGDLVQLHSAKTDPKTNTPFDVIVGYGYYEDHEDEHDDADEYEKDDEAKDGDDIDDDDDVDDGNE